MKSYYLFTLFLILIISASTYAQNADIRQFPPQPNILKLSDLWNVSVTNLEQTAILGIIKVRVTLDGDDMLIAESTPVGIPAGSRNYQGRLLEPINYSFINDRIVNSIRRTGTFPDGKYSVCLDLIDRNSGLSLANSCLEHTVATSVPPVLFAPYDATDIYDNIVVWSWFMQPETSSGEKVVCDLIVVEILEGQTAEEALKVNPPVVSRANLTTASWQSNFAMRNFRSGSRYAWKVIAKAGGKIINESEIWKFTYNSEFADNLLIDTLNNGRSTEIPVNDNQKLNNVDTTKFFRIDGKFRLTLENSNNQALLSKTPKSYARFEAEPNIYLGGVPIGLSFLLTTEENTNKYNMNRGAFKYESRSGGLGLTLSQRLDEKIEMLNNMKEMGVSDSLSELTYADSVAFENRIAALYELQGKDLTENIDELKQFDLVTEEQEIIAQFPSFGIGKVAPSYSEYFMNGVTLAGGMIEYNPDNLYFAGSLGKLQNNVNLQSLVISENLIEQGLESPEFYKNVYTGRIGYGRRNGDIIILSALYSEDDDQSKVIKNLIDTTGSITGSENNMVLGLAGRYNFESIGLSFQGELNASVYNTNINGGTGEGNYVNPMLKDIFGDNIKSGALADVSYNLRTSYKIDDDSRFDGAVRFVGPGYKSVGIAGVRNDLMIYDLHFYRNFIDNKIRFSAFYSNEESGFILSDLNNSSIGKIGSRLEFRFRDLPVFTLNYVGNMQKMKLFGAEGPEENSIHQITANTSYGYQIGTTRMLSFLSYTFQKGISHDSAASFDSHVFMLNQRVSLSERFAFGVVGGYTETINKLEQTVLPVYSADISFLHNVEGVMTTTLGINYNYAETGEIKNFYFNSRFHVTSFMDTDVRVEARNFSNPKNPKASFNETIARLITVFSI